MHTTMQTEIIWQKINAAAYSFCFTVEGFSGCTFFSAITSMYLL